MHVLIIDDHPLFREGVKILLTELADNLTVSDASAIEDVTDELFRQVDLVLLDLTLGRLQSSNAMQQIQGRCVPGAIVVISSNDHPQVIKECIDQGAAGFIPKSANPDILIPALQMILSGGIYLPPESLALDPSAAPPPTSDQTRLTVNLTQRQKTALQLVCRGLQNKVIAREMNISENTVRLHLSAAYRALEVNNRTEAMYKISSHGIAL